MKIDKEILKTDTKKLFDETMKCLYFYEECFTLNDYIIITNNDEEDNFNEFKSTQIQLAYIVSSTIQLSPFEEYSTEKIKWLENAFNFLYNNSPQSEILLFSPEEKEKYNKWIDNKTIVISKA